MRGRCQCAAFRSARGMQRSPSVSQQHRSSSIGEEMGVLWLVPARTMRATAADCLLPLSSQAIRKHLRDRGVGAGVAPEFLAKRNSKLVGIRDGAPTTPSVSRLATRRSLRASAKTPASPTSRYSEIGTASLEAIEERSLAPAIDQRTLNRPEEA